MSLYGLVVKRLGPENVFLSKFQVRNQLNINRIYFSRPK